MAPAKCAEFLCARTGEKREDDVVVHPVGGRGGQDGINLLGGERLRWPAVAAARHFGKGDNVSTHPVARHRSTHGSVEARVGSPQRLAAEGRRESSEPSLDLAGGQVAKLASAQKWDDVLVAQELVLRDGRFGLASEAESEPVLDCFLDRVGVSTCVTPASY